MRSYSAATLKKNLRQRAKERYRPLLAWMEATEQLRRTCQATGVNSGDRWERWPEDHKYWLCTHCGRKSLFKDRWCYPLIGDREGVAKEENLRKQEGLAYVYYRRNEPPISHAPIKGHVMDVDYLVEGLDQNYLRRNPGRPLPDIDGIDRRRALFESEEHANSNVVEAAAGEDDGRAGGDPPVWFGDVGPVAPEKGTRWYEESANRFWTWDGGDWILD